MLILLLVFLILASTSMKILYSGTRLGSRLLKEKYNRGLTDSKVGYLALKVTSKVFKSISMVLDFTIMLVSSILSVVLIIDVIVLIVIIVSSYSIAWSA